MVVLWLVHLLRHVCDSTNHPLAAVLLLKESEDVGPGMLVAISVSCILMLRVLRGTYMQIIIRVKHIRRPCHGDVVVD